MNTNRHGLARHISEAVKREVRQRCGFGCVICGNAIIQYEHFRPEFSEALSHEASGITLLCGGCHGEKTKGLISNEQIAEYDASPFCLKGGASSQFRVGREAPIIHFGATSFKNCRTILNVRGFEIVSIAPAKDGSPFYLLTAQFFDNRGVCVLKITDNEWVLGSDIYDATMIGSLLTVRGRSERTSVKLRFSPPREFHVEELEMTVFGRYVKVHSDGCLQIDGTMMGGLTVLGFPTAIQVA